MATTTSAWAGCHRTCKARSRRLMPDLRPYLKERRLSLAGAVLPDLRCRGRRVVHDDALSQEEIRPGNCFDGDSSD